MQKKKKGAAIALGIAEGWFEVIFPAFHTDGKKSPLGIDQWKRQF
jgi:hypothetical protein